MAEVAQRRNELTGENVKILLPDTIALDPDLPPGWEGAVVDAHAEIPPEHHDADVLVVWAPSREHLASAARVLTQVQLVQSLSAGMDKIVVAGFAPSVRLASGSGLHDRTVCEHTLTLVLSLLRRIPEALAAQGEHRWSRELGGPQELHPADRVTTLIGARVLIWGFGGIAQTMAPLLRALGAEVTGVARSAGTRADTPVHATEELPELLPHTDVLISTLPATEATAGVVDQRVFALLPESSCFVNVGRGTVVDQAALVDALQQGAIRGAAVDVTDPEPLPADSDLWSAPNLLITPHAAGGRPIGAEERIAHNVRALQDGRPLAHEVRR